MTCSTLATLLRTGQGISFVNLSFFLGALVSAEAPQDYPETLEATTRQALPTPEASSLPFLP